MTVPAKDGVAVVQVAKSASIGVLPPEVQAQLELRKLSNQVAGKLAEQNWGKALDLETRRAVADWGRQYRVDVVTEIHVLGGNVYLNSAFYLRQLAEMISEDLVEYAYADHVAADPRLKEMGDEGVGEWNRRLRERILHRIPDEAKAAVVFRVKLRSMEREIAAAKYCGGVRGKNDGGKFKDPIGEEFPGETAESRAARRAMRLITSYMPKERVVEIESIESSSEALGNRVAQARRASIERDRELEIVSQPLALPAQNDPYGAVSNAVQEQEPVKVGGDEIGASSVGGPTGEQTPAPTKPSFGQLATSISKLLKHPSITVERRTKFADATCEATTVEQLQEIIGQIEECIE